MSNSLSVAMATAALRSVLAEALPRVGEGGVENARVTTLRPDMLVAGGVDVPGINVFLYEVVADGHGANAALPARRPDGALVARPRQALDLHYLLTFTGDEPALEPQRLLGAAVGALAERPVLSRELVRRLVQRAAGGEAAIVWQQFSDLADEVDVVRLTLMPLSLEELSKLWSTFFQATYRLSVAYHAAVVFVEGGGTPEAALPVLTRGADVAAFNVPSITRVVADGDPTGAVVPGTTVVIEGLRLRGPFVTRVRFGDVEVTVPSDRATGTRLVVTVPPGVVAGVRGVQVLHPRLVGSPPVERGGAESAAAPVIVRPAVTGPVTAQAGAVGTVDVRVPVAPAVGRHQRVLLVLNEHHPPPPDQRAARAYVFTRGPRGLDAPATVDTVTVVAAGVVPGEYLVRVQVEGAESVLTPGADGRLDQPRVTIP